MISVKERPILFNAPMVRAILAGDKTNTRREIVRLSGFGRITEFGRSDTRGYDWHFRDSAMRWHDLLHAQLMKACPYGQVGERLWVRESFWIEHDSDSLEGAGAFDCGIDLKTGDWASVCYCSDQEMAGTWIGPDQYYPERTFVPWGEGGLVPEFFSKRPNIHMPRWASRILLEITGVRVERLWDGDGEVAWESRYLAEGIHKIDHGRGDNYYSAFRKEPHPKNWADPFDAWRELWNSTGGEWDANPWVWVVEFRRIKQ